MGSNLTSEHDHSRPADILLPNWALGKPADKAAAPADNPGTEMILGLSGDVTEKSKAHPLKSESILRTIPNAMLWAGVVYLWSQSPMVLGERKPWTRLKCLPPVVPSYRGNQSQLCCLNCIAGSTCIW